MTFPSSFVSFVYLQHSVASITFRQLTYFNYTSLCETFCLFCGYSDLQKLPKRLRNLQRKHNGLFHKIKCNSGNKKTLHKYISITFCFFNFISLICINTFSAMQNLYKMFPMIGIQSEQNAKRHSFF